LVTVSELHFVEDYKELDKDTRQQLYITSHRPARAVLGQLCYTSCYFAVADSGISPPACDGCFCTIPQL